MVRIPSLSRRSEPAPTRDESRDGRVDERGEPTVAGGTDVRGAAGRHAAEREAAASARAGTIERDRVDTDLSGTSTVDRGPDVVVPAGPRPRASMLATLALIAGVAAALVVLTGTLAGYGIGVGGLAILLAIGGVSATGRRHIAGRSDALIGLALGLGAVVVGVLAMTGQFTWPDMDGDTVQRFREWLDAQSVDRF